MRINLPQNLPDGFNQYLAEKVFGKWANPRTMYISDIERIGEAPTAKVFRVIGELGGQESSFIIKLGSTQQIKAVRSKENHLPSEFNPLVKTLVDPYYTDENDALSDAIALYTDAGYSQLVSMTPLKMFLEDVTRLQDAMLSAIKVIQAIHQLARKPKDYDEYQLGTAFLFSQLKTDLTLAEADLSNKPQGSHNDPFNLWKLANAPYSVDSSLVQLDVHNYGMADSSAHDMKYIESGQLYLTLTAKFINSLNYAEINNPPAVLRGRVVSTRYQFYRDKLIKEGFEVKDDSNEQTIKYGNISFLNPFTRIREYLPKNWQTNEWLSDSLTLSDNGMVHGDCNASNFLLDTSGHSVAMIDFERASVAENSPHFGVTERCAPIAWDYLLLLQSIKIRILEKCLKNFHDKPDSLINIITEFESVLWVYTLFPEQNRQDLINQFRNSTNDDQDLSGHLGSLFTILDSLINKLKDANRGNKNYDYVIEISKVYFFTSLRLAKHSEVTGVKFIACVIAASFSSLSNPINILKDFLHRRNAHFVLDLTLKEYDSFPSAREIQLFWQLYGDVLSYYRSEHFTHEPAIRKRFVQLFDRIWEQDDIVSYGKFLSDEAFKAYKKLEGIGLFVPIHAYEISLYAKDKSNALRDIFDLIVEYKNLLILGDRGGGKSTISDELIFQLIGFDDRTTLKIDGYRPIPIVLPLRSDEVRENLIGINKFKEYIQGKLKNTNEASFDVYLSLGIFLFVIDGLNEIPDRDYTPIVETIFGFTQLYPLCRYVVTSRRFGYRKGLENFTHATLVPFDDAAIQEYFQKKDQLNKFSLFMQKCKQLLDEYDAFRTPFVAVNLINSFLRHEAPQNWSPPRNLKEIYKKRLEEIFDDIVKDLKLPKMQEPQFREAIHSNFETIAYDMTTNRSLEIEASSLKTETVNSFTSVGCDLKQFKLDIDENIIPLFLRHDLLVGEVRKDETFIYRFHHHSYLEYLTSNVISNEIQFSDDPTEELNKYLRQRYWDETIQLVISYLVQPQSSVVGETESTDSITSHTKSILYYICQYDIDLLVESLDLTRIELLPPNVPVIAGEILSKILLDEDQPLKRREQAISGLSRLQWDIVQDEFEECIFHLAENTSKYKLLHLALEQMSKRRETRCQSIAFEIVKGEMYIAEARVTVLPFLDFEKLSRRNKTHLKSLIFSEECDIRIRTRFIETFIWSEEHQRIIDDSEVGFLIRHLSTADSSEETVSHQIASVNLLGEYEIKLDNDILVSLLASSHWELIRATLLYFDKLFILFGDEAQKIWEQSTPNLETFVDRREIRDLLFNIQRRIENAHNT